MVDLPSQLTPPVPVAIPRLAWVRLAGWIVVLALFTANVARMVSLGMENYPYIVMVYAIPPALTDVAFGHSSDYTSLIAVNDTFYKTLNNNPPGLRHDKTMLARAIASVLALDPRAISPATALLASEDKGIVDFVKIAFRLFGYANEKIIYLYFILMFGSICLFLFSFRGSAFPQALIAAILVGHYLILPMVFHNGQLVSVLAPRFMPVLGIIPCLHGLFFAVRPRLKLASMCSLFLQILLLVFILHIRTVAAWELAMIGFAALCAFSLACSKRRPGQEPRQFASLSKFAGPLIPLAMIATCLAGLHVYRRICYDPRYFGGQEMVTRPFWHNILSGLAFDPALGAQYRLKVDDLSEVHAVGRFLVERGRVEEWKAMGGITPPIRWADYDHPAGELLWSICREQPKEFFAALLYFKPLSLIHDLEWLYGFRRSIPDVDIFVSPDVGNAMELQLNGLQADLDLYHQRFVLWDPLALGMILVFAVILAFQAEVRLIPDLLAFGLLALGSLIPTFVGYPAMHTIGEPAIMCAATLYVGAVLLLSRILARLWSFAASRWWPGSRRS